MVYMSHKGNLIMKDEKTWVIGCTHFGHEGSLHWTDNGNNIRPGFKDIDDMDNTIIERWNDVVDDNDIVYHLGDVFFCKKPKALEILTKLKGRKRLILGNHDNKHIPFYVQHKGNHKMFQDFYVDLPLPDLGVILSHRPLHDSERYSYHSKEYMINIHAHVHVKTLSDSNYFNACVENINYTPKEITEIVKKIKKTS